MAYRGVIAADSVGWPHGAMRNWLGVGKHFMAYPVRGDKLLNALADLGRWTIEIVTRTQSVGTFKAEPRRWVVERTFAWLGRNRRRSRPSEPTARMVPARR